MIQNKFLLAAAVVALFLGPIQSDPIQRNPMAGNRIYIRHKRMVEREGPPKESTVVLQSNSSEPEHQPDSVMKDYENEIATSEQDCQDFMKFDYNPMNDSLFFTGHIPSLFHELEHPNRQNPFEALLHQMLSHTQSMLQRFPSHFDESSNYPENYNGTVEEQVTIGGRKFLKKKQIINKSNEGSKISIMSTVYVPIDEDESSENKSNATVSTKSPDLTDGRIITY